MTYRLARMGSFAGLLLVSSCVLVDNPNHLALADAGTSDDELGTSESLETSVGESTSASTSESDTLDASSSDTQSCPLGTLDCACTTEGLCDAELTCHDGVCAVPLACPAEDPAVTVTFALDPSAYAPTTQLATCSVQPALLAPDTLSLLFWECDATLAPVAVSIAPFVGDPPGSWNGASVTVLLRAISPSETYLRVTGGPFDLWAFVSPSLDPGDPVLTDFPLPLDATAGDCPLVAVDCGTSERRAISGGATQVFDGQVATLIDASILWVDEAELACGQPSYSFAWIGA